MTLLNVPLNCFKEYYYDGYTKTNGRSFRPTHFQIESTRDLGSSPAYERPLRSKSMNERIQKLWDTANIRHTNDYMLSGKPREEWKSVPEIFSELIVQETLNVALYGDEHAQARGNVKTLFGVAND
jgi:hypothetical protein